jgi:hypothetical protein
MMTRKQLERQLEAVEAQVRWAILHHGDHELLNLLRFESCRLSAKIVEDRAMSRYADWRNLPRATRALTGSPEVVGDRLCLRLDQRVD